MPTDQIPRENPFLNSAENHSFKTLKIGTRGSALALWQANRIQQLLQSVAGVKAEIIIIKTQGDQVQNLPLNKLEGKGFFTKELEDALLDGRIDLAVHSMKDLPTELPEGLCIAAVPERELPDDWLLIRSEACIGEGPFGLKRAAKVGTSSNRRSAQLLLMQADLELVTLRGNVPTRIQKLRDGMYDAILVAGAGVTRLNADLDGLIVKKLDTRSFIPAPAQGALAIECRDNDQEVLSIVDGLHDPDLGQMVQCERDFLNLSGGGCHAPVGAWAEKSGNRTILHTFLNNQHISFNESVMDGLPARAIAVHQSLQKPSNETILLIRSPEETRDLTRWLQSTGRSVRSVPGISIQPDGSEKIIQSGQRFLDYSDVVLYTSRHSVEWVVTHLKNYQSKPCVVIGPATLDAARTAGIADCRISETGNSEGLQTEWHRVLKPEENTIFYPVSAAADTNWVKKTDKLFHVLPVYGITHQLIGVEEIRSAGKLVLFSASGAESVIPALEQLSRLPKIITIGPKTSAAIRVAGLPVFFEAPYPSMDHLLEGILR